MVPSATFSCQANELGSWRAQSTPETCTPPRVSLRRCSSCPRIAEAKLEVCRERIRILIAGRLVPLLETLHREQIQKRPKCLGFWRGFPVDHYEKDH